MDTIGGPCSAAINLCVLNGDQLCVPLQTFLKWLAERTLVEDTSRGHRQRDLQRAFRAQAEGSRCWNRPVRDQSDLGEGGGPLSSNCVFCQTGMRSSVKERLRHAVLGTRWSGASHLL